MSPPILNAENKTENMSAVREQCNLWDMSLGMNSRQQKVIHHMSISY